MVSACGTQKNTFFHTQLLTISQFLYKMVRFIKKDSDCRNASREKFKTY